MNSGTTSGKARADKKSLRAHYRLERSRMCKDDAARESMRICAFLEEIKCLAEARLVAAFHPVDGEPDIRSFIRGRMERGTRFCFPRRNAAKGGYEMVEIADFAEDFTAGDFGIPEPKPRFRALPDESIGSIPWLVPGVAFDAEGGRLGHGKGFYDRLLKGRAGVRIGICFEIQIADAVPSESGDEQLDFIVTGKGVRSCTKRRK